VALVLGSFRSAIADWVHVPTGSMQPTVLEGDRLFVNKVAYDLRVPFTSVRLARWADPERGSIVLFRSPDGGQRVLKRVIGIPGDRISLRDNRLFVNGEPADYQPAPPGIAASLPEEQRQAHDVSIESVGGHDHFLMTSKRPGRLADFGPVDVPEGKLFLMGDNRDNSLDCRTYGFVDRDLVLGRITGVAFSVNPRRHYLPRPDRFFRSLR
jgi:signal peptidase I